MGTIHIFYGILSLIGGFILMAIGLSGYLLIGWMIQRVGMRIFDTSDTGIFIFWGSLIFIGFMATGFFIFGIRAIKFGIRCFIPVGVNREELPHFEAQRLKGEKGQIIHTYYGTSLNPYILFLLYFSAIFVFTCAIIALLIYKKEGWLLGVVICAIGSIALTYWFAYIFLKVRKFGRSTCNLKTLPVFVGATLEAEVTVEFPKLKKFGIPDLPIGPVKIDLRNITGKGRHSVQVNWITERKIPWDFLRRPGDGTLRIPVNIDIPLEVLDKVRFKKSLTETSLWQLRIKASYPGADYMSEFVVPVNPPNSVS